MAKIVTPAFTMRHKPICNYSSQTSSVRSLKDPHRENIRNISNKIKSEIDNEPNANCNYINHSSSSGAAAIYMCIYCGRRRIYGNFKKKKKQQQVGGHRSRHCAGTAAGTAAGTEMRIRDGYSRSGTAEGTG